ncbi:MAG TPA: hypothetical protein VNO87_11760 [Methylomirabilota bacterium]|nr:hypothetical protein [Methylomirabilota bacterium]
MWQERAPPRLHPRSRKSYRLLPRRCCGPSNEARDTTVTRNTVRRRAAVALAVALGFYALSDILLWQRIFEAHQLSAFDTEYQTGHVAILVGLIGVGAVLLIDSGLWALWFGGALYTMAFGGAADVLYYWFDGRPIPGVLPWLDGSRLIFIRPSGGDVTNVDVLASAAFWLAVWLAALLLFPRIRLTAKR